MGLFDKLDDLIERLESAETSSEDAESDEAANEEVKATEEAESMEQDKNPEDAAIDTDSSAVEDAEKLIKTIELQQKRIDSLTAQIGMLIKDGATINDGKSEDVVNPPSNIPEEYEYLKDLDYTMEGMM